MKKKNNNLLTWAMLGLIGIAVIWLFVGRNSNDNSSAFSAGDISVEESKQDFGSVSMQGGKVSRIFEVKNKSSEPVTIEKVYTSCMCTAARVIDGQGRKYGDFGMPGHGGGVSKTKIRVEPGQMVKVEAIFDPAAHGLAGVGLAQRSIYLETNSAKSPKLELSFQAMVTR